MRLIIWAKSLSLVTITAPASLAASNIILPVAPSIPNSAIGWASTAKLPVIHDAARGDIWASTHKIKRLPQDGQRVGWQTSSTLKYPRLPDLEARSILPQT